MGLFSKSKRDTEQSNSGLIETYKVVYKGGLPEYPKAKVAALIFQIFTDRFEIHPTNASKWFSDLAIQFDQVGSLKIVERQVSTAEGLLGGLNSRQLNQPNNINISFLRDGQEMILRLEMLTGITVMGQAQKCRELEDRLNTNDLPKKFQRAQQANVSVNDIAGQIGKLDDLRKAGVLTEQEFVSAKTKLLNQ